MYKRHDVNKSMTWKGEEVTLKQEEALPHCHALPAASPHRATHTRLPYLLSKKINGGMA